MSKRKPYWSFWKVIFAGWIIRYPEKVFNVFRFPLMVLFGSIVVMIYNALRQ